MTQWAIRIDRHDARAEAVPDGWAGRRIVATSDAGGHVVADVLLSEEDRALLRDLRPEQMWPGAVHLAARELARRIRGGEHDGDADGAAIAIRLSGAEVRKWATGGGLAPINTDKPIHEFRA
jgi:hypothetical protein